MKMDGRMIPIEHKISPQLSVRICQTEKLKAGMLALSVVLPIRQEQTYMVSLLLSVLLRGTKKYPSIASLNRRLDYLFGTGLSARNYYRGDHHVIGLSADLLGEEYLPSGGEDLMENVLDVMREILFCPLLDENGLLSGRYVESEKGLQCDAIRSLRNSPRAYAIEHFSALLYDAEPNGVPIYGTEEQIEAVTPEMLTACWRRLLEQMQMEFFYVGSDRPDAVCERISRVFLPMIEDVVPHEISESGVIRTAKEVRRAEEELPVAQGQLVLGLRTGVAITDADYYACTVANEMLGVSPVSKLFVNVRERHSLCYHCSSHYNLYKGVILINCGLHPKNRELAEREILKQIDEMRAGHFDDAELAAAKRSLVNSYRQIEDSPTSLENYYLGRALFGVRDSLAQCREGFETVTREDVLRAVNKWTLDTVYFLNGTAPADEEAEDEAD